MNAQEQRIAQLQHQVAQLQRQRASAPPRPDSSESGGVGDFLSGAGQIALGVVGGIFAADLIGDVAGDLFDDLW